ncbi:MAG: hypothetical protein A3H44_01075 [Gammaproteobacteria bacterium RIFCSPLOWO2_02_FULL_57_10]|nr:MAG: hypothetical protein A3H44_01075 [Gammaproteobacteria bacterium RIFCSPLOWO2_02_FULL_57_10]
MRFEKFAPQALALVVFCCTSMTGNAQQDDSPLAGTGITPNVIGFDDSASIDSETGEVRDPLMRLNRAVFAFNDVSYRYAIIPAARVYQRGIPAPVRTSVGNFFDNIKTPISFANHLLQVKPREAGVDVARFLINSTIGLAGLFDPATSMFDMERDETGLSETLMQYGAGHGTYIVLPFIGPSNVRDGSAMFVDGLLNPLAYVLDNPESAVVRVFDNFQEFAPQAEGYLTMRAESEDLYIFMRNLHLQGVQRDAAYQ